MPYASPLPCLKQAFEEVEKVQSKKVAYKYVFDDIIANYELVMVECVLLTKRDKLQVH